MDEPILQLLNHLTLRHFLWGAAGCVVILIAWAALSYFVMMAVTRRARR